MSNVEFTSDASAVEGEGDLNGQSDPMSKPSVEQPDAPIPGGEDEQAIQLDPPLSNPSEAKEK